jgi:hypothetical protein
MYFNVNRFQPKFIKNYLVILSAAHHAEEIYFHIILKLTFAQALVLSIIQVALPPPKSATRCFLFEYTWSSTYAELLRPQKK